MCKLFRKKLLDFIFIGFVVSIFLIFNFTYFGNNSCKYFIGIGYCLVVSLISKVLPLIFSHAFNRCHYRARHLSYHWGCLPLLLVSPDYVVTRYAKDIWRMDVEKKRTFIILSNLINLIISSILIFVSLCFKNKSCIQLICAARFLSRSFEIMPSFVLDVASNSKSSSVSKGERVILAITSYLEIFFLLFVIYFDYHGGKFSETFYNFLQTIFTNSCSCCKENADIDTFVFVFYIVFTAIMITHVITNYIKDESKKENNLMLVMFNEKENVYLKLNSLEWSNIKKYISCHRNILENKILIQKAFCPDYDGYCDYKIGGKSYGEHKALFVVHDNYGTVIGIIYKIVIGSINSN